MYNACERGIIMRDYKTFGIEDYEVTADGEIINRHTGRTVKGQPNGKGYLRVSIGKKLMFVHRLVAERYVPNPDKKPQVNHKDGNKLNNHANNLEWVTNYENRQHAVKNGLQSKGEECPWAKLNKAQVVFIRNHPEILERELAKLFGVSRETISAVRVYKSWKD